MNLFVDHLLDISKIDENEIKMKDLIKKGIQACDVAIVGIPFDGATFGRQGAKYAPRCIREALYSLDTYSYTYDFDLSKVSISDFGDVIVYNSDPIKTYENIKNASKITVEKSKLAFYLGGDHSITGAIFETYVSLGCKSILIFDAHHDIRELKRGFSSSGTYLRNFLNKDIKIIQIGIRDFYNSKRYAELAKEKGIKIYTVEEIRRKGLKNLAEEIKEELEGDFYISIDMDVLDAFFLRDLNSLCVNGLLPSELIELSRCFFELKPKAIDIVELLPLFEKEKIGCMLAAYLILSAIAAYFK